MLLNGCPIIWTSKLMDAVCVSTVMAEHCALSLAMREVPPPRDLIKTVANGCGIAPECRTVFKVHVWEDNMGALTPASSDPGQTASRSRFCDSKAHWFRSHLSDDPHNSIEVQKVDSKFQLADIFTKPPVRETFSFLRNLLMGW